MDLRDSKYEVGNPEADSIQAVLGKTRVQLHLEVERGKEMSLEINNLRNKLKTAEGVKEDSGRHGEQARKIKLLEEQVQYLEGRLESCRQEGALKLSSIEGLLGNENGKIKAREKDLRRKLHRERETNKQQTERVGDLTIELRKSQEQSKRHEIHHEGWMKYVRLPDQGDWPAIKLNTQQNKKALRHIFEQVEKEGGPPFNLDPSLFLHCVILFLWWKREATVKMLEENEVIAGKNHTKFEVEELSGLNTALQQRVRVLEDALGDCRMERQTFETTMSMNLNQLLKDKYELSNKVARLEDTVSALHLDNNLLRAEVNDRSASQQAKIELNELTAELKSRLQASESQLRDTCLLKEQMEIDIRQASKRLQTLEQDARIKETVCKEHTERMTSCDVRRAELETITSERQAKIWSLQHKLQNLEESHDTLRKERDSFLGQLTKALDQLEDSREQTRQQDNKIRQILNDQAHKTQALKQTDEVIDNLRRDLANHREAQAKLTEERGKRRSLEVISTNHERLVKELEERMRNEEVDSATLLAEMCGAQTEERERLEGKIEILETEREEMVDVIETLSNDKAALHADTQQLKLELERVSEKLHTVIKWQIQRVLHPPGKEARNPSVHTDGWTATYPMKKRHSPVGEDKLDEPGDRRIRELEELLDLIVTIKSSAFSRLILGGMEGGASGFQDIRNEDVEGGEDLEDTKMQAMENNSDENDIYDEQLRSGEIRHVQRDIVTKLRVLALMMKARQKMRGQGHLERGLKEVKGQAGANKASHQDSDHNYPEAELVNEPLIKKEERPLLFSPNKPYDTDSPASKKQNLRLTNLPSPDVTGKARKTLGKQQHQPESPEEFDSRRGIQEQESDQSSSESEKEDLLSTLEKERERLKEELAEIKNTEACVQDHLKQEQEAHLMYLQGVSEYEEECTKMQQEKEELLGESSVGGNLDEASIDGSRSTLDLELERMFLEELECLKKENKLLMSERFKQQRVLEDREDCLKESGQEILPNPQKHREELSRQRKQTEECIVGLDDQALSGTTALNIEAQVSKCQTRAVVKQPEQQRDSGDKPKADQHQRHHALESRLQGERRPNQGNLSRQNAVSGQILEPEGNTLGSQLHDRQRSRQLPNSSDTKARSNRHLQKQRTIIESNQPSSSPKPECDSLYFGIQGNAQDSWKVSGPKAIGGLGNSLFPADGGHIEQCYYQDDLKLSTKDIDDIRKFRRREVRETGVTPELESGGFGNFSSRDKARFSGKTPTGSQLTNAISSQQDNKQIEMTELTPTSRMVLRDSKTKGVNDKKQAFQERRILGMSSEEAVAYSDIDQQYVDPFSKQEDIQHFPKNMQQNQISNHKDSQSYTQRLEKKLLESQETLLELHRDRQKSQDQVTAALQTEVKLEKLVDSLRTKVDCLQVSLNKSVELVASLKADKEFLKSNHTAAKKESIRIQEDLTRVTKSNKELKEKLILSSKQGELLKKKHDMMKKRCGSETGKNDELKRQVVKLQKAAEVGESLVVKDDQYEERSCPESYKLARNVNRDQVKGKLQRVYTDESGENTELGHQLTEFKQPDSSSHRGKDKWLHRQTETVQFPTRVYQEGHSSPVAAKVKEATKQTYLQRLETQFEADRGEIQDLSKKTRLLEIENERLQTKRINEAEKRLKLQKEIAELKSEMSYLQNKPLTETASFEYSKEGRKSQLNNHFKRLLEEEMDRTIDLESQLDDSQAVIGDLEQERNILQDDFTNALQKQSQLKTQLRNMDDRFMLLTSKSEDSQSQVQSLKDEMDGYLVQDSQVRDDEVRLLKRKLRELRVDCQQRTQQLAEVNLRAENLEAICKMHSEQQKKDEMYKMKLDADLHKLKVENQEKTRQLLQLEKMASDFEGGAETHTALTEVKRTDDDLMFGKKRATLVRSGMQPTASERSIYVTSKQSLEAKGRAVGVNEGEQSTHIFKRANKSLKLIENQVNSSVSHSQNLPGIEAVQDRWTNQQEGLFEIIQNCPCRRENEGFPVSTQTAKDEQQTAKKADVMELTKTNRKVSFELQLASESLDLKEECWRLQEILQDASLRETELTSSVRKLQHQVKLEVEMQAKLAERSEDQESEIFRLRSALGRQSFKEDMSTSSSQEQSAKPTKLTEMLTGFSREIQGHLDSHMEKTHLQNETDDRKKIQELKQYLSNMAAQLSVDKITVGSLTDDNRRLRGMVYKLRERITNNQMSHFKDSRMDAVYQALARAQVRFIATSMADGAQTALAGADVYGKLAMTSLGARRLAGRRHMGSAGNSVGDSSVD